MTRLKLFTILSLSFLLSCSSGDANMPERQKGSSDNERTPVTLIEGDESVRTGIELFIDSLRTENYLLDTTRIKQTIWSFMIKHPTAMDNGHQIIQLPFPVDEYSHHFTQPKTYFFAQWNEKERSFKNGNDYLLMTWKIDGSGIEIEKEIYPSLHAIMGNFPCYIFRSDSMVYAMSHRSSNHARETRVLTERLRNYIDKNAIIINPFDGSEPE